MPKLYTFPQPAVFSPCKKYRYRLERWWGPGTLALNFLMLNPSDAGADDDDPTIRKCVGFARVYGYWGIRVVNMFTWIATHPKELHGLSAAQLNGPDSRAHLLDVLRVTGANGPLVCAWGRHTPEVKRMVRARYRELMGVLPDPAYCLGYCADGSPAHPLMLSYERPLEVFDVQRL